MGFFTEWFVAPRGDAQRIVEAMLNDEPTEQWPQGAVKNVGQDELATLWGLLDEQFRNESSVLGEMVFAESQDGPFVAEVRGEFIERLGAVVDSEMTSLANQWKSADANLEGWRSASVELALKEFVEIARTARDRKTPVLELLVY